MEHDEHENQICDAESRLRVNPLARVVAPVAALVATIIARRVLDSRYTKVAKGPVPTASDLRVTFRRAVVWSAVTALVT